MEFSGMRRAWLVAGQVCLTRGALAKIFSILSGGFAFWNVLLLTAS